MGGYQVPGRGPGDDGYDEDGYDESQRAEILEATRDGPNNGTVLTDLNLDLGEDIDEVEDDDDVTMMADEASAARYGDTDAEDDAEDEAQAEFDDETVEDDDLRDGEAVALNP